VWLQDTKAKEKKHLRYDVLHLVSIYSVGITWSVPSVVDPAAAVVLPAVKLVLSEPQRDLLLGAGHGVAAVDHVPATQNQNTHMSGASGYSRTKF